MYTGQDFLIEVRQGATQYQTEFLNPALAQYIADQALSQLVEQACREYPQQRSIDKIYGLIRAHVPYPVLQNRLVLLPGIQVTGFRCNICVFALFGCWRTGHAIGDTWKHERQRQFQLFCRCSRDGAVSDT